MLTHYEARKVQAEMQHELEETSNALWKCAAGLFIVTALALFGAESGVAPATAEYASSQSVSGH